MEVNSSNTTICGHLPFTVNMVAYVPGKALDAVTISTCVFNAVSCAFTLIGNILVFVGVLGKQDLHTVHYTSILFLAGTDLMVASIAQPAFVIFQATKLRHSGFSCVALAVYTSTVFLCTGLSILTLIIITVERYFAIFHPFKYQQLVTTSRLVCVIFTIWFLWTLFISLVRFTTRTTTSTLGTIATILILSCLLITLFVYLKVQKLVLRNRRVTVAQPTLSGVTESCNGETRQRQNIPETKSSRTVGILTGTLALCLLPTIVASAILQTKATKAETLYHVIYPLTDTAVILNSTLNPFVYVFRSNVIRRSIRDTLKRWTNL